jgi:hypothetical protein
MIYCLRFLHAIKLDKEILMIAAANRVYLYETNKDIETMEPYAVIQSQELASILKRFVSWAAVIATHPEVAEIFGKSSTAHIKLATDLRLVIKNALKLGTYPNVVLPSRKFMTVMTLSKISQLLEPEIPEFSEKEVWE